MQEDAEVAGVDCRHEPYESNSLLTRLDVELWNEQLRKIGKRCVSETNYQELTWWEKRLLHVNRATLRPFAYTLTPIVAPLERPLLAVRHAVQVPVSLG